MKGETMSRDELRKACLDRLEQRATEHPAGHQGKLAARYIVHREDGERIGLMFEKGEKTRPNLWVERRFARELMGADIEFRIYLASSLYQPADDGGKPAYGRHAGLKAMRDLANADLVRFTICQIPQLDLILDRLVCFSHSDV